MVVLIRGPGLHAVALAAAFAFLIGSASTLADPGPDGTDRGGQDYLQALAAFRDFADYRLRDRVLSPLPEPERLAFTGISYFDPDPRWVLPAAFLPARDTSTFAMPTYDHRTIAYSHYGTLVASRDGEPVRLKAFLREDGEVLRSILLVPFRDATNGGETYPGGRYLEIELPLAETPVLDFNRAMNPLCAYDPSYACPIPPPENHLPLAVRAGEKTYR